jgi:hypothetical protein
MAHEKNRQLFAMDKSTADGYGRQGCQMLPSIWSIKEEKTKMYRPKKKRPDSP